MPENCVKCKKSIAEKLYTCPLCVCSFHLGCAAPTKFECDGGIIEGCIRCSKNVVKRKLSTIAKQPAATETVNISGSNENPSLSVLCKLIENMSSKIDCLPLIQSEITSIKTQMKEDMASMNNKLDNAISECAKNTSRIDSFESDMKCIEERLSKLEKPSSLPDTPSTCNCDSRITKRDLEFSMNRVFEIVIIGLTDALLFDVKGTLEKLAKLLQIPFEYWHIAFTRVIQSRRSLSKLLLVRFISPSFRNTWLKAKRVKGSVKCSDISLNDTSGEIYINQRETFGERRAFIAAKSFAKSNNYYSCWMNNGKIFLRKTVNSQVTSYSDTIQQCEDQDKPIPHDNNSTVDSGLPVVVGGENLILDVRGKSE